MAAKQNGFKTKSMRTSSATQGLRQYLVPKADTQDPLTPSMLLSEHLFQVQDPWLCAKGIGSPATDY